MSTAKNLATAAVIASVISAAIVGERLSKTKEECFRVTGVNAKNEYVLTDVCMPAETKAKRGTEKVPGLTVVKMEPIESARTGIFRTGDANGFECACSPGDGCEQLVEAAPVFGVKGGWREAPRGLTLAKGHWRGALCIPKACVELASRKFSSWPKECPQ